MNSETPSSKLLINEPPLQVLPSLAIRLGLNEAIFVQQLHYMIQQPALGKVVNGQKWVFNTMQGWHKTFPWWSVNTIRRIIEPLVQAGVVLEDNLNDKLSRTKWYTIDHVKLDSVDLSKPPKQTDENKPNFGQRMNEHRMSQVGTIESLNLGHTIVSTWDDDPKTPSETSSENTFVAGATVADPIAQELDAPIASKQLAVFQETKEAMDRLSLSPMQVQTLTLLSKETFTEPEKSPEPPKESSVKEKVPNITPNEVLAQRRADAAEKHRPRPRNAVGDAIARSFFNASDEAGINAVFGRVAPILHGRDYRTGRCDGLYAYEQERTGEKKLDLDKLATDVATFAEWFGKTYSDLNVKDCAKFMDYWQEWRGSGSKVVRRNVDANGLVSPIRGRLVPQPDGTLKQVFDYE